MRQHAARRTLAFTLPWDHAPLDLSPLFAGEKPAGKHGFLGCRAGRMVFEDGTEARFWGTNFNSAANFPSHAYSETVARRLAQFGVNLVRFHQLDGDWSTPNIFQFSRGPRLADTRRLDPESMDRLDYLVHCLKREGIYIYLDLLTYRRFRSGDGVAGAERLGDAARPYSNFDARLIDLQKEFCAQLWTHVNPHTGLAYKDDPAIALTEIANENELFSQRGGLVEPYRSRLQDRYLAWLQSHGRPAPAGPVDFSADTEPLADFLLELQQAYYADMLQHLRGLGVRIPVTGTNWAAGGAHTLAAHASFAFTDSHTYWYGWSWKPDEKRFLNDSMLGTLDPWYRPLSFMRLLDKPFFVSEWDDPWPNEWRAESPLYLAAVAGLQGWSGAAIHTYRYDCRTPADMIAMPVASDALAGIPYRGGVFDTFNDPAKFGLFYHAALMLRRGDVKESAAATEVALPGLWLADPSKPAGQSGRLGLQHVAALAGASEVGKVAMRLPGAPARAPTQAAMDAPLVPPDTRELRSDTGELYRNLADRYGVIDTPRTKAAYGFLGAQGEIVFRGLRVRCQTDFAVIALSSLTDEPLDRSDNILVTAVGRADNTGAAYNDSHTLQYDRGRGPILAEVIEAEIELETRVAGLKVAAVNPDGMLIGPAPETSEPGKLRFALGGQFPSIYYLIQKV